MTSQQSLQLFEIVKRNFKTESDSRLFVTEIDALISSSFKEESSELSTKKDLDVVKTELLKELALINKETVQLRVDLTKDLDFVKAELLKEIALINKETVQLRVDLTKEITLVRSDLTKEIALVRSDLTKQIDASKIELIKWTFSFWVTLLLFLVGSFFLKK